MAGVAAALFLAGRFVLPREYQSEAAFMPQAQSTNAAFGGIAAQLGVAVPSSDPTQSPHFYVDLLRSPEFLRNLGGKYPSHGDSIRLETMLGITSSDSVERANDLGRELMYHITALVSPRTGVVTVDLNLRDAVTARAVLGSALNRLDEFNIDVRRSRAQSERKFTETRVKELEGELRAAEDRLEQFLQANRLIQTPDLAFQRDRLTRDITLRQQVYASMVQAFEQAKIDEVRDTPVLTRLSGPTLTRRPTGPGPARSAAYGLLLGIFGASVWAIIDALRSREVPVDYDVSSIAATRIAPRV
ncbi:MAG: hypothetical protein ACREPM_14485 [Gemmatimonadaceae bacterium]